MLAKIHICAGLLTLVNLMVFGAAGLGAALGPRGLGAPHTEYRAFTVDPGWTDRQAAEQVVSKVPGFLGHFAPNLRMLPRIGEAWIEL